MAAKLVPFDSKIPLILVRKLAVMECLPLEHGKLRG